MSKKLLVLILLLLFAANAVKIKVISNQELAKQLHKPIIRKFEKLKVVPSFINNIWGADLADMQL